MPHVIVCGLGPGLMLLPLTAAFPRDGDTGWAGALQPANKHKMQPLPALPVLSQVISIKPLILHLGVDFASVFESMCVQCASWAS